MALNKLVAGTSASDPLASTGADVAAVVNGLVDKSDGLVSIAEYGAIGDGTDETAKINLCLSENAGKTILIPAAETHYLVTTINIPANTTLVGVEKVDVYNPLSVNDFNGGSTFLSSGTSGLLNPQGVGIAIHNISFVGNSGRTAKIFTDASDPLRMDFSYCGFYYFAQGFGHATKTIKVSRLFRCHLSQNNDGIRNLVDSMVANCEINANQRDGVFQSTGANDTSFTGCKVEWNVRHNWQFYQSNNCSVSNCITDRSGDHGFLIAQSNVTISGGVVRRSGYTGGKAHFRFESNPSVLVTGLYTKTGANDDGSGTVSPDFVVSALAPNTGYMSFSNCDMTGYVLEPMTGSLTNVFTDSCNGVASKAIPTAQKTVTIPSGGSDSVSVGAPFELEPLPTNTLNSNKIRVNIATRNESTGSFASQEFIISIQRSFGSAASASVIFKQNSSSTAINETGAVVNMTIGSVSADGTSLSLNFANTSANNIQCRIYAYKYDQA